MVISTMALPTGSRPRVEWYLQKDFSRSPAPRQTSPTRGAGWHGLEGAALHARLRRREASADSGTPSWPGVTAVKANQPGVRASGRSREGIIPVERGHIWTHCAVCCAPQYKGDNNKLDKVLCRVTDVVH